MRKSEEGKEVSNFFLKTEILEITFVILSSFNI